MNRSARITKKALVPAVALLLHGFPARTAQAQVFVGADAGLGVLSQEGHAPPLCCGERDRWSAFGGRVGGRLGYQTGGWFFARLDAGVAAYRGTAGDDYELSVVSPDVALLLGARVQREKLAVEVAAGAGWRRFSGSATSDGPGTFDHTIGESTFDLRVAFGAHHTLGGGHRLGGELGLAKVLIAENVITFSFVYTWDGRG